MSFGFREFELAVNRGQINPFTANFRWHVMQGTFTDKQEASAAAVLAAGNELVATGYLSLVQQLTNVNPAGDTVRRLQANLSWGNVQAGFVVRAVFGRIDGSDMPCVWQDFTTNPQTTGGSLDITFTVNDWVVRLI